MKKIILFCLFYWHISQLIAQSFFKNPSFEGLPQAHVTPIEWESCGDLSTPDTQPGIWGVATEASDLNSYVGMVCRPSGSYETISQTILYPLNKDSCYSFSLDIAKSTNYDGLNSPAILRCWEGFSACEKGELLWISPPIDHINWQRYKVTISPNSNYTEIMFDVTYTSSQPYGGNVLIDNLLPVSTISSTINVGNDTVLCEGEEILLDASKKEATYLWQDGSTNSQFLANKEGVYWVEVMEGGCKMTDTIVIDSLGVPSVNLGDDTIKCEKDTIVYNLDLPFSTINWSNGKIGPNFHIIQGGEYWVNISNKCGFTSGTILVDIEDCQCFIFIPNAFTPNFDGKNDNFSSVVNCSLEEFEIAIFNRWGEQVYNSNDINKQWDGKLKGETLK